LVKRFESSYRVYGAGRSGAQPKRLRKQESIQNLTA